MNKKIFTLVFIYFYYVMAIGSAIGPSKEQLLGQFFFQSSLRDRSAHLLQLMDKCVVLEQSTSNNPDPNTRRNCLLHLANKNIPDEKLLFVVNIAILPTEIQTKIISNVLIDEIKEGDKRLNILSQEIGEKHRDLFLDAQSTINPLTKKFQQRMEESEQLAKQWNDSVFVTILKRCPEFEQMHDFFECLEKTSQAIQTCKPGLSNMNENSKLQSIYSLLENFQYLQNCFNTLCNHDRYQQVSHKNIPTDERKKYDWHRETNIIKHVLTFNKEIKALSLLLTTFQSHIRAIDKYAYQPILSAIEDHHYAMLLMKEKIDSNESKIKLLANIFCGEIIGSLTTFTRQNIEAFLHFNKKTSADKIFSYVITEKFTLNNINKRWILYPLFIFSCMGKYFPDSYEGWKYYILWNYFAFSTLSFALEKYEQKDLLELIDNPIRWIPTFLNFLFNNREGFGAGAFVLCVAPLCPMAIGKIMNMLHNSIISTNDAIIDIPLFSFYYTIAIILYQFYTSHYTESIHRYTLEDMKKLDLNDISIIRRYI